ncbi:MAG: hypothetical protein HC839_06595 [Leptolyngbyaceae cyanobacterium RM2_2_21]|nr:hypothetical protein [Leptolyngbyaceae cyanobacterium RM2_2_21]
MVSRSRKIPVRLARGKQRFLIFTEQEWAQKQKPAFEMHPKLGFFAEAFRFWAIALSLAQCKPQAVKLWHPLQVLNRSDRAARLALQRDRRVTAES